MGVKLAASVAEFFHEVVSEAMEIKHLQATPSAEFYLVSVLDEFTTTAITDKPLSIMLVGQENAAPAERVHTLKQVGDTALYVAGFFADSLERSLVDVDYYIGIGETAYRELANRLQRSSVHDVYTELSEKFPCFVDVLSEVRAHVNFAGSDIIKLYEAWTQTKAEWIEDRLCKLGVFIPAPDKKGYLQ